MLLGGLWRKKEEEVKELRINTEDAEREGRSTQRGEWEDGSIEFRIGKNPTRKGGVWGTHSYPSVIKKSQATVTSLLR